MGFTRHSHCKVNLLLNILGRRADGFHELETVMQPVGLHDSITFEKAPSGITLTCSDPRLAVDRSNLVHRAAGSFLEAAGITDGVRLHLDKRIPLEAGLGGGSGNAAVTLAGLNELFGGPLDAARLEALAAGLGSDVPFFLQDKPALAIGRGEKVTSLEPFAALQGRAVLLMHPGFGVSTAWAYKALGNHTEALNGRPGRATRLVSSLASMEMTDAAAQFYNSLEAPVLHKYPILSLFQEFLMESGAEAALMSGSGSTTFAICRNLAEARRLEECIKVRFGATNWTVSVPL